MQKALHFAVKGFFVTYSRHKIDIMEEKTRVLFGNRVREYRHRSGLTQQELADLAGLHRSYIGEIELGRRNITLDNATKIAKALNVSLTTLLE